MITTPPIPYQKQTPEQQNEVIMQLAALRSLRQQFSPMPRFLSAAQQQSIREAAGVLMNFPNCIENVQPMLSSTVINARHANRVLSLIDLISQDLIAEMSATTLTGDPVLLLPQSRQLRRGRPTSEESERFRRDTALLQRAKVLSALSGLNIAQPDQLPVDDSRPSDTSRRKPSDPDLFSQAIADAIASPIPQSTVPESHSQSHSSDPSPAIPSGSHDSNHIPPSGSSASNADAHPTPELKSLRAWSWLLPTDLASRVSTLHDLRTSFASHSEQAKILAEQGATSEAIAEHTNEASRINEQIADLYSRIDNHLALMYCMFSQVNADYQDYAKHYAQRGGITALLADLKPYYDKITSTTSAEVLLSKATTLNDKWIQDTTVDPVKQKRLHTIYAYFTRKDVSASRKRLDKLISYRLEAEELGADADVLAAYDLIINDCRNTLAQSE